MGEVVYARNEDDGYVIKYWRVKDKSSKFSEFKLIPIEFRRLIWSDKKKVYI